jgi:hypothetical protein
MSEIIAGIIKENGLNINVKAILIIIRSYYLLFLIDIIYLFYFNINRIFNKKGMNLIFN